MTPPVRFCLDENVSPLVGSALRSIYKKTKIDTVQGLGLRGTPDVKLIAELGARGYGALITGDLMMLERRDEVKALVGAGMHWVGFTQPLGVRGRHVIAAQTALILAGMSEVERLWSPEPTAYRLPTVVGQKLKIRKLA